MDKISLFTLISCASRKIYYNDNISKPIMLAFTDTNYENKRVLRHLHCSPVSEIYDNFLFLGKTLKILVNQ